MKFELPLPLYKKLTVTFRVEPGCLGPEGAAHIKGFCKHAKKMVVGLDSDFIRWVIIPRYDKSLPETEYKTNGKRLNQQQAALYLSAFNKKLDDFEAHLDEQLTHLIDSYLGR
ncbi:hypothetical protein [Alteromonas sp. M12]|uniref:hypothetical protein n=1 Tax=Alteromonas sp. M12 TaxID=3135644 RepID=UPI00319DE137